MEPFKNIFNKNFIQKLSKTIKSQSVLFDSRNFEKQSLSNIESLEMKQRVKQIADALSNNLEGSVKENIKSIVNSLAQETQRDNQMVYYSKTQGLNGFETWPLNQYIEIVGLEHLDLSMNAFKELTKRFSSEFSIRIFISKYDQKVYDILEKWTLDENPHVRRLVSEGSRPLLPWGKRIENITNNLERNVLLLKNLIDDESKYVQKSIANHMNDISKLDINLFFSFIDDLNFSNPNHKWIARHASRTLLKSGDIRALQLHGYKKNLELEVNSNIKEKKISEGEDINLEVNIRKKTKKSEKLLIDYIIHFKKSNGSLSGKNFRLRDTVIETELSIKKTIKFKRVTTRKHYEGIHYIEIQINGKKYSKNSFELVI